MLQEREDHCPLEESYYVAAWCQRHYNHCHGHPRQSDYGDNHRFLYGSNMIISTGEHSV